MPLQNLVQHGNDKNDKVLSSWQAAPAYLQQRLIYDGSLAVLLHFPKLRVSRPQVQRGTVVWLLQGTSLI